MIEAVADMTVGELAGWGTLILAGLSTVIEISPIKLNPWKWLARKIGRAINGEVLEKVDNLEQEIKNMKDTEDERDAKAARARVLRFGDELAHDVHHSKEHFDDVLQDITDYEKYCREHPKFENDRMHLTAEYIKSTYRKCLETHNFL